MSSRLVWNVDIDTTSPLPFHLLHEEKNPSGRWESRFFWREETIVTLYGLNQHFFNFTHYDIKERHDVYYLLADSDVNIKLRKDNLWYKPKLEQSHSAFCFAKKINLNDNPMQAILPGTDNLTTEALLDKIHQEGQAVSVDKIAMVYKLPTHPTIKLEIARCQVFDKIFFSFCIEGRSQTLVDYLSQHLIKGQESCDYVHYLKQLALHDN